MIFQDLYELKTCAGAGTMEGCGSKLKYNICSCVSGRHALYAPLTLPMKTVDAAANNIA